VRRARAIKPDLYIVVDAVQHAPHGLIDLQHTPIDGITIAPYKFFGCRGSGFAWLSDRAACLPHHKLAGKGAGVWDLGSVAPWQFAVLSEIVDHVCWIGEQAIGRGSDIDRRARFATGMEAIVRHEKALLARLLHGDRGAPGLRHIEGVTVYLDHDDLDRRDLIIAIGFDQLGCADAVREYEKRGVIVYERVASSLYSRRMLESFGLQGGRARFALALPLTARHRSLPANHRGDRAGGQGQLSPRGERNGPWWPDRQAWLPWGVDMLAAMRRPQSAPPRSKRVFSAARSRATCATSFSNTSAVVSG
jgi:selenocysteine lyase/cysteine desulfurase